ncbi:MAG: HAMP domain-containing protein [Tatlockia sp.]|nr:HAMP domain-containing protein [Tatlockia sp.]
MRSLYWKIFLTFWLATILIIFTTAWVTSEIAQKSSIPARERVFMDSYAHAAVITFESGQYKALKQWLAHMGASKQMTLYLLTNTGEIIGNQQPPEIVNQISANLAKDELDDGLLKFGDIIVSHEIISLSGKAYRLVAVSKKPLAHFVEIPWAGLTLRLGIATIISGFICYLLSVYLTKPLRLLRIAARSIATGNLHTRVGHFKGHYRDEIAELSGEFDKMAEQLEEIMNSKERLLQDISHELRSPLARMQIAIELGRNKATQGAEAEFERMETECLRLNALIGEILDFARLDNPSTRLNKTLVNLPDLVKQVVDDANFEVGGLEPVVVFHPSPNCELFLEGRLVHRAIENIIRNAIRYSIPNPQINIHLYQAESNREIIIDIEDNGPGVPEEELEKIFNPFYRVDPSREKKTGGYGLGLSIAQQAIKLHHGCIRAVNRQGGGLKVTIVFPILVNQTNEII